MWSVPPGSDEVLVAVTGLFPMSMACAAGRVGLRMSKLKKAALRLPTSQRRDVGAPSVVIYSDLGNPPDSLQAFSSLGR